VQDQGYGVYCSRFVCLDESGRTKAINNAVLLVPAEGVDFYHSYRVGRPEGTEETSYRYQSLGYYDFLPSPPSLPDDLRSTERPRHA